MVCMSFSGMIVFQRGISDLFGSEVCNLRLIGMDMLIMMMNTMKVMVTIHLITTNMLLTTVAFVMLMTLVNVVSGAIPIVLLQLILRSLKIEMGVRLTGLVHRCIDRLDVGSQLALCRD